MTQNQPQQHDETSKPSEEDVDVETSDVAEAEETVGDDRLVEVEAELAETKDRMLRAMAETENMRRRATREADEARKYSITSFARELLEVSDNLARALESVPEEARSSPQVKSLVEGIELTQRTLANCFERQKITKVDPEVGEKFDHNLHQAMFETETDAQAAGSVTQVMQAGYRIADRLLRPAMVGVAKKPAAPVVETASEADDQPAPDDADSKGQRLNTSA